MQKPAKAVDYANWMRAGLLSKIGKAYLADASGPPLLLAPAIDPAAAKNVCLEFEDLEARAARTIGVESDEHVLRLGMNMHAARRLCGDLVRTLAKRGDRVAMAMVSVLEAERKKKEQGSHGDGALR